MSLKPKRRTAARTKHTKSSRQIRTLRQKSPTEIKIEEINKSNRELVKQIDKLVERKRDESKYRSNIYDMYYSSDERDNAMRLSREQEDRLSKDIDSLSEQMLYHMESIETLREREQVYRDIEKEGYEHSRLEPTPEAEYFRKVMRREFGKGMKFDIDGSHVTVTYDHWDNEGFADRVLVEIADRMHLIGLNRPYGDYHAESQMRRHIKTYDGYSVAEFEVGHLDIDNPVKFEHINLGNLEY
jgi:hypothetical protein